MKFNPFERMTPGLLAALRKKGKRWLVSQTLDLVVQGPLMESKKCLLLSHYEDQGMATVHLKAVAADQLAALIDLDKETHRQRLCKIMEPDSSYLVFSSLIRSKQRVEKIASEMYKDKYWKYIQQHSRGGLSPSKHLRPSMQLIFGEIYIILKYGAETIRTRLSEIEKM